jgi:alpha-1,2-glucosyltransferase
MLYIWPFMAFFSLPLLYPSILELMVSLLPFSIYWPETFLGALRRLRLPTVIWLLGSIAVAIGVVHFNTIIHPFTQADNRHYVFYVFRYTIRRHPLVKYALAPLYVLSGFLVLRTLAGSSASRQFSTKSANKAGAERAIQFAKATSDSTNTSAGPTCSFTIIWLVSTALSLITAPLVEPRYFIIPWVIWRLHVPALPLSSDSQWLDIQKPSKGSKGQAKKRKDASTACWAGWLKHWAYKGHDHRLWFETIWFLLISLLTSCIFLFGGYEWPQEPGKVQRFMW